MKLSELTCCPFCGSETFYYMMSAKGYILYRERFDKKESELNCDMYDSLDYKILYGGRVYCEECYNYLGNKEKDKLSKEAKKIFKK